MDGHDDVCRPNDDRVQMRFVGARANLAKCLRYAINGGRDEISGEQIAPPFEPVKGDVLDFDDVLGRFEKTMDFAGSTSTR